MDCRALLQDKDCLFIVNLSRACIGRQRDMGSVYRKSKETMQSILSVIPLAAALAGIYLTSLHDYLLFHSLAEVFSIVIAAGIFMVAWNARRLLQNHYLLFVGIAYLYVGGIDLLHTLAYKGMGVFEGHGADLPTQLWVAGRYMEAVSLLLAPLFLRRKLFPRLTFAAYGFVTAILLASIFWWRIFPRCLVEGVGLTPFKIYSEYAICLIFLAAAGLLAWNSKAFERRILVFLIASIAAAIAEELAFTTYLNVYGHANLVGHLLKVISFYLIYKAIVETGLVTPWNLLFRDLKQSEEKFRGAFANAAIGFAMTTPDGRFVDANPAYCAITGYAIGELGDLSFSQLVHPDDREENLKLIGRMLAGQIPDFVVENRYLRKDARVVWVRKSVSLARAADGKPLWIISLVEDVTDRKQAEQERETAVEFLRLINRSKNTEDLIHAATEFFQRKSGCEAVGIRIRRGNDFPYYEARGFPPEFIQWENSLCSRDQQGQLVLDDDGVPVLECLCGDVIRGRFDASKPCFTSKGSFWTSGPGELQAAGVETGRQTPVRNRCNSEGYQSVALIALRLGEERLGLLQLNDKRSGRFTRQTIALWERLADYMAVALSKFAAEEALRELNATLETRVAERTEELQHRAWQLQKLAVELSQAEDRERRRLAELLHDDLQQQIAAAKFHVALLGGRIKGDPSLQQAATAIDDMLMDAIQKSRSLSHELCPAIVQHGTLRDAVLWLAEQMQIKHGLIVDVEALGEVDSRSDAIKSFLFRATQELLFNVVKHARLNRATVRVRRLGRCLYLSVSDRGQGFDPGTLKAAKGFGLFSIRERVELMGGRMRISSVEGHGSTFSIAIVDAAPSEAAAG